MSTLFVGEGNIGSVPEFQEFNSTRMNHDACCG